MRQQRACAILDITPDGSSSVEFDYRDGYVYRAPMWMVQARASDYDIHYGAGHSALSHIAAECRRADDEEYWSRGDASNSPLIVPRHHNTPINGGYWRNGAWLD